MWQTYFFNTLCIAMAFLPWSKAAHWLVGYLLAANDTMHGTKIISGQKHKRMEIQKFWKQLWDKMTQIIYICKNTSAAFRQFPLWGGLSTELMDNPREIHQLR